VLAHELSHALADQNFNLARFIRQGRKSDDGSTARLAVMEGQATWLMSEYLARKSGRSLKDSPALASSMSRLGEEPAGVPVYDNAPLYMRLTLVFPYARGMLFQNARVRARREEGFGEVFRRAPVAADFIPKIRVRSRDDAAGQSATSWRGRLSRSRPRRQQEAGARQGSDGRSSSLTG